MFALSHDNAVKYTKKNIYRLKTWMMCGVVWLQDKSLS